MHDISYKYKHFNFTRKYFPKYSLTISQNAPSGKVNAIFNFARISKVLC